MEETGEVLTLEQLADKHEVRPRTVRFYITQGLLPGPIRRGRAAGYGEEHGLRLELIKHLSERGLSLNETRGDLPPLGAEGEGEEKARERLERLRQRLAVEKQVATALRPRGGPATPRGYVEELLRRARAERNLQGAPREQPTAGGARPTRAASTDLRGETRSAQDAGLWQRWVLAPGVELHVRSDAEEDERDLIRRVLHAAGVQLHDRSGGHPP